ncbi:TPA: adhesin, partial [Escherichia coli]|nr:adhesin [Escherichia coli]
GMILATGRIICREIHTGFQIWMNDRQEGGHPRHYVIQNSKGNQGELRVRIGGNSWFSSLDEEWQGWIRLGKEKQVNFDVIVDGEQYIPPGKYIFSVSGKCMASEI